MKLFTLPGQIIHVVYTIIGYAIKAYLIYFFIQVLLSFVRLIRNRFKWTETQFKPKIVEFVKWLLIDRKRKKHEKGVFPEFGLTLFANRQGSGKTISIVEYLERMRKQYPKAKILTNFRYEHMDKRMDGWKDLRDYRNGTDGVIFVIDELQNEFDCLNWQDVPEWVLGDITQQRKDHIKIVASSQVFTRVAKQFREQTFEVVECKSYPKKNPRWTFCKVYDAYD